MSECEREVSADLLSVILPAAARRAIGAYEIFSSIPPDGGDAKEFGAFQTACKAAVGHLTALYQLQRLVAAAVGAEAGTGAASEGRRVCRDLRPRPRPDRLAGRSRSPGRGQSFG